MPAEKIQERSGLSENTERDHRPGLCLTDELELRFLENLREHGRTKDTISVYRRNLSKLRKSLPEDSNLTPAFLSNWQSELLDQGYSPGTVNSCTATVNSLLEFAGRRDLQAGQLPLNEGTLLPELTRNEYLRLLQTAKLLGKRQTYLLVLMFGTMDLPLHALARVTVEAVREGWSPTVFRAGCASRPVCGRSCWPMPGSRGSGAALYSALGMVGQWTGGISMSVSSPCPVTRGYRRKNAIPGACGNCALPRRRASDPVWNF